MKAVTLNRPALWRSIRNEEMSVRKYAGAYPYLTKSGILNQSSATNPVIRYAKNYTKFKQQFSLFIFSDEKDSKVLESFLDAQAKRVAKEDIVSVTKDPSSSNFKYLETYYGGSK